MKVKIIWYKNDLRFVPGTVADIGNIRLSLSKTKRNRWRLYMAIRTRQEHGIKDDLKREVVVAEFKNNLTLSEAQIKAEEYLTDFISGIIVDTVI